MLRFQATPERLSELDEVNRAVNHEIEPATDAEIYGVNELWTMPTSRGDCEDFALLKRQRLMARGWPANALLMTVVRDEKNEGHAILTARTSQGDFVLDNKIEAVRLWNQTPYHFVMRQSYIDPKVWVSLDATILSSTRRHGWSAVEPITRRWRHADEFRYSNSGPGGYPAIPPTPHPGLSSSRTPPPRPARTFLGR